MSAKIQKRTKRLGEAPVARLLFQLGLPGMISMMIMTLYNVTDTFWVAKLGPAAIAALTIVFPYQILLVAFGVGSGAGFSSVISRRFGQGQVEETNHIASQIFPITFTFGLIFCLITTMFTSPVLNLFGATKDIHAAASSYLGIIGFGAFFVFFSMISNNIFRGSGNTIAPMIFMGTGALLNILLDPFLIFGIGFFPALGVKGAAIATIISQFVAASAGLVYLLFYSGYRLRWSYLPPKPALLADIYQVGLPTLVMQFAGSMIIMVINRLLGAFGSQAIAAFGLIFRLMQLIVMPIAGLAQGLLPIVGYNFGAKQNKRLWQAVWTASLTSAGIIGFGYILLQLFPRFWISLFTQDAAFLPFATHALRLTCMALPAIGPPFMWITTFQALGKGTPAMLISLTRQVFFLLPLLLVLPKLWGLDGIYLSLPIADTLAFLVAGIWIIHEYCTQRKSCRMGRMNPLPDVEPT